VITKCRGSDHSLDISSGTGTRRSIIVVHKKLPRVMSVIRSKGKAWGKETVCLLVASGMLLVGCRPGCLGAPDSEEKQARLFLTPEWLSFGKSAGRLFVRRAGGPDSSTILLTTRARYDESGSHYTVYRLRLGAAFSASRSGSASTWPWETAIDTLTRVPYNTWDEADTPVTDCWKQQRKSNESLTSAGPTSLFDSTESHAGELKKGKKGERRGKLFSGGDVVKTTYPYVLGFTASPDRSRLAVATGEGPIRGSLGGFLSRGVWVEGPYYNELLDLPSLRPDSGSDPVRLPSEVAGAPCWTPGGNYLLYPASNYYRLGVVEARTATTKDGEG
jgi:hypothetical protein